MSEKSELQLVKCMEIPVIQDSGKRISVILKILRDYSTKEKYFEILEDPDYTYYVTNDDVIDKIYDANNGEITPVNDIKIEDTYAVTTKYSELLKSVAFETGNEDYFYDCIRNREFRKLKNLHHVPIVHGSDINLADYYIAKHYEKYPNDSEFYISKSYFDIEVDAIDIVGFPSPEEAKCPINAFSLYFDEQNMLVGLFLRNEKNPLIETFEKNIKAFKKRIKEKYEKLNIKDIKVRIKFFDDEIELIKTAFDLINHFKPDYSGAWNLTKFDIPYIISRISVLGYSPEDIICPPEIPYHYSNLVIDNRNQDYADKGSYYLAANYTNFIDQLLLYAALRKSSKKESYRLDDIAQEELKEKKVDYEAINATIKNLPYVNYELFVEYNLHDTMLLHMIEDKVRDIEMIDTIGVVTNTRVEKAFKKTVSVINLARVFYKKNGFIMSNNHNRDYDGTKVKNNKKYRGAYVALPDNNGFVGIKINGKRSKYVHRFVIDEDLTSLYPSIILTFNSDSTTLIGHIEPIEGDEFNTSEFANDLISDNVVNFANKYFKLPLIDEILDDYENSKGA